MRAGFLRARQRERETRVRSRHATPRHETTEETTISLSREKSARALANKTTRTHPWRRRELPARPLVRLGHALHVRRAAADTRTRGTTQHGHKEEGTRGVRRHQRARRREKQPRPTEGPAVASRIGAIPNQRPAPLPHSPPVQRRVLDRRLHRRPPEVRLLELCAEEHQQPPEVRVEPRGKRREKLLGRLEDGFRDVHAEPVCDLRRNAGACERREGGRDGWVAGGAGERGGGGGGGGARLGHVRAVGGHERGHKHLRSFLSVSLGGSQCGRDGGAGSERFQRAVGKRAWLFCVQISGGSLSSCLSKSRVLAPAPETPR